MGITFKENCPDIRNTKVVDVYRELRDFGLAVDVYDPWAAPEQVQHEYGVPLLENLDGRRYDGIIVAVAHREFLDLPIENYRKDDTSVIFDIKSIYEKSQVDLRF